MTDQSMQAITTDVEKELLNEIIQNLDEGRVTEEEARKIAQEFLDLLPMQDKKDLLDKIYKLSIEHTATKMLYLKYSVPYEEEQRQKKLTLMSEHIKKGEIDRALAVAKQGMTNEA